ncbi:serine hydrolase domain-containing protein [Pontibacter oryzae]|uniref:serine hydrolase domain-containing protein n=1 Tax=Pontibacter oryzae TaxID=2304593 RepID=UPI001F365DCA|nr:serine hydrolase domain-containing protein [Pontibacter oryzae]
MNGTTIEAKMLDQKIDALVKAAQVQGLVVTVFNDNKSVYQRAFGYKNAVTKEPINGSTNFYGASLSKAVFAVLVMKLVEEGKIDLDKPLQSYLPKPIYTYKPQTKWHDDFSDLKEDSLYARITARMCLAHTSGFPNWRWFEPDKKLRVKLSPGSRYSYSGEGLVYLQVVLEKLLGKPMEQLMQEKVFGPAGMAQSSYTWQPRFEADHAVGHTSSGELYKKDKDNEARAASTLETTPDDYARFISAVLQHKIISQGTTSEMFRPQIRIRSARQFGPLSLKDTTAYDGITLSYGLGWGLIQTPHGTGAFKEGHSEGFQHYSIIFPEQGTGVVILSNSDNAESIFKALLEVSIGDTYTPWNWNGYTPYTQKSRP